MHELLVSFSKHSIALICCCLYHFTDRSCCAAVIFPSLLQLQRGITDMEDKKQKAVCMERYTRRDGDETSSLSDADAEREEECGICMEMNSKVVLPNCTHAMCLRCYQDWYAQISSFCPHHAFRVTAFQWRVALPTPPQTLIMLAL
jgi:hypothetical protein